MQLNEQNAVHSLVGNYAMQAQEVATRTIPRRMEMITEVASQGQD